MFKKITATNWKENLLQSAKDDELFAEISRETIKIIAEYDGQDTDWRKEKKIAAKLSERLGGRKVWIETVMGSHKSIRVAIDSTRGGQFHATFSHGGIICRTKSCPLDTWVKWGERGAVKRAAVKDVAKRVAKIEKAWATLYAEAQALDALDVKNDCFDDSQMRKHMSQLFY